MALRTVPHRDDFYNRILQGGSREKLDAELERWLQGLEKIIERIKVFLESGGCSKV